MATEYIERFEMVYDQTFRTWSLHDFKDCIEKEHGVPFFVFSQEAVLKLLVTEAQRQLKKRNDAYIEQCRIRDANKEK